MSDHPTDQARRALEADNRLHQIICDWIREDAPLTVKMSVMPEHVAALVSRLASLRAKTAGGAAEKPPLGLLMSMALRYDHGIGAPVMVGDRERRARELDCVLTLMGQLWEEVAGQGFYRPEKEADYAVMAERIRAHRTQDQNRGGEE